jgi:ATP-dependent DNA helicase RecG
MSATPIPQTLAKTIYGDLDIVTIEGLPAGRPTIKTHLVPDAKRGEMERFVLEQIVSHDAQVYYVVPRVERDDDEETGLKDALSVYDHLTRGAFSSVPAAFVHGRLPVDEKERIVRDFRGGAIRLLVATTVVEVGIDSPGATVMVIENAERFGLAQLHQLRGRVGRAAAESYCFLLTGQVESPDTSERLRAFCGNHDGFRIAEMDLKLRGPGQIAGARQAGWDEDDATEIMANPTLFQTIRKEVEELFGRAAGAG